MMQGVRGAITVDRNDKEEIIAAVVELLSAMQEKNGLLYIDRTPKVSMEEIRRIFGHGPMEEQSMPL